MADLELMRRIGAIGRLAKIYPAKGMADRMETIRGLANGTLSPEQARPPIDHTFFQRLADGKASRSPRTAEDKLEATQQKKEARDAEAAEETRRKARTGRNRMDSSGTDRSEGDRS